MDDRVGIRLHTARVTLTGLSQRRLAEKTGHKVSGSFISRVEKGYRKPSVETLGVLADALGVDAHHLAWGHSERMWGVFDIELSKLFGPYTDQRDARTVAKEIGDGREGLVYEMVYRAPKS